MRPLTAIAIATGTFTAMAAAAYAQFSPVSAGVEMARAQAMPDPQSNFRVEAEMRNYPQPATTVAASQDGAIVTTPEQVREIIGSMQQNQAAPAPQVQQQIAAAVDAGAATIDNGDCRAAIATAEKKYGVPPYMLQAIALTESGREGSPYPWAMNIQGRAYYASGPQEIQTIVDRYGSNASIDIGCAQVNLKFHGFRFADWRSLIDPQTNADYAAYHLMELRREMGSWNRAVSAYHSRTPWRGANYACAVSRNYGRILGDLRPGCGPDIEILANYLLRSQA